MTELLAIVGCSEVSTVFCSSILLNFMGETVDVNYPGMTRTVLDLEPLSLQIYLGF